MSKTESGATNGIPKSASGEPPRRCHVVKVPDFDGYGFNLHAEKGKPGQYIGKVDDASPAQRAGLRQGDRIIEVNGVNIGRETHKEVVQRIKAIANEVQLLVVDASVTVSKDNRIVDIEPAAPEPKTHAAQIIPPPPPRETLAASNGHSSSVTPDIVDQLPAAERRTSAADERRHSSAIDTVDHAVVSVAAQSNGHRDVPEALEEIVPITIKTGDLVSPGSAGPSSPNSTTSTFSTPARDHSQTNGKFISTASFITGEEQAEPSPAVPLNGNAGSSAPKTSGSSVSSSPPPSPSATTASAGPSPPLSPKHSSALPPQQQQNAANNNISSSTSSSSSNVNHTINNNSLPAPVAAALPGKTAEAAAAPAPLRSTPSAGGLNLNMTVAELRAKLAAKKKFDPKNDSVDLRKKFEIVEKL